MQAQVYLLTLLLTNISILRFNPNGTMYLLIKQRKTVMKAIFTILKDIILQLFQPGMAMDAMQPTLVLTV